MNNQAATQSNTTPATSWDDMEQDLDFTKESDPAKQVHPFESKGLGRAPYDCTGMRLGGGSHCDYCGTFIKNEYNIKSSDGRHFVVGSDCVLKTASTNMRGFKEAKRNFDRQARQNLKARKAASWAEEYPELAAWIEANWQKFGFAQAMKVALAQYGSLTEGQRVAVENCIRKSAERKVQIQVEVQKREERAEEVQLTAIAEAFERAKSKGLKWPKIRLGTYLLKLAGDQSRNPGAIYVSTRTTQDTEGVYLGKVTSGKFFPGRDCDAAAQSTLMPLLRDPEQAAVAFGRMTGACSICGRALENRQSVERGIGPICAANFGW